MSTALNQVMNHLLVGIMILLAVMVCLCLVRAIKGPTIADRIVAGNMIGTMTIIFICILAIYLKESYLIDVAIVYAMISFLAVIVLCKVYMGVYVEQKLKIEQNKAHKKEEME